MGRVKGRRKGRGAGVGSWRREAWAGHLPRAPPVPSPAMLTPVAPSRQRPPFCPFAALDQQPRAPGVGLPPNGRGVDLGVAVILQSSDQTVLLTRRTSTLKVSPNLWVPPGERPEKAQCPGKKSASTPQCSSQSQ